MRKSNKLLTAFIAGTIGMSAMGSLSMPAFAAERQVVKQKAPKYPRAAERRGIEGFVVLEYTILADGAVQTPVVVEATPAGVFDQAAIKAVEGWKFEPAAVDTPAVQTKLTFKQ